MPAVVRVIRLHDGVAHAFWEVDGHAAVRQHPAEWTFGPGEPVYLKPVRSSDFRAGMPLEATAWGFTELTADQARNGHG